MEELLGSHKDFSVPIFRCTQAHLFFTPHQSITTIEQTAAISTGKETLLPASTELKASNTHAQTGAVGNKVRQGKRRTHPHKRLFFFFVH